MTINGWNTKNTKFFLIAFKTNWQYKLIIQITRQLLFCQMKVLFLLKKSLWCQLLNFITFLFLFYLGRSIFFHGLNLFSTSARNFPWDHWWMVMIEVDNFHAFHLIDMSSCSASKCGCLCTIIVLLGFGWFTSMKWIRIDHQLYIFLLIYNIFDDMTIWWLNWK